MKKVIIFNQTYDFCRTTGGSFTDKFNRILKLALQFEKLSDKFDRMISKGNCNTQQARLALAVKMMMYTGIRIGNEGSAEGYITKPHPNSPKEPEFVQTYGLTTLKPEHIIIAPRRVCLNFIGKKQVENSFIITGGMAKQIRSLVRDCNTDTLFDITAYELTNFIKTYVGNQFLPKDFRTLTANMVASGKINEIMGRENPRTKSERNKEVKEICVEVSEALNNTPGVCKTSYIDPMIWDYFESAREIIR